MCCGSSKSCLEKTDVRGTDKILTSRAVNGSNCEEEAGWVVGL